MVQRIIFTVLSSLLLSGLMTLWVTWINLGAAPDFAERWRAAFLLAWPAAAAISFAIGQPCLRLSGWLARKIGQSAV